MLRACIALLALAAIGRADDGAAALHAEAMAHARAGRLHEADQCMNGLSIND